jgi:hypothetical protein
VQTVLLEPTRRASGAVRLVAFPVHSAARLLVLLGVTSGQCMIITLAISLLDR